MGSFTIRLHRVLSAPPERVYRAFLDAAALAKWRAVAEGSAWKDYAAKSAEAAELLKLALQVQ